MIAYFLLKEDKQSSCIVINVLPDKYEGVLIESNSSIHLMMYNTPYNS